MIALFSLLFTTVLAQEPSPVDTKTVISGPYEQNPDYTRDVAALRRLHEQLGKACAWTGRIRHLQIDRDTHTVVVLAEIEGHAQDTVVFSWGQVLRTPVPQTPEDVEQMKREAFPLTIEMLEKIPAAVEAAIQANPTETVVQSVALTGVVLAPRMEIVLQHPRKVLEPIVTPLAVPGREAPPDSGR